MSSRHSSYVKYTALAILLLAVYLALSISRLPPIPLSLASSILLVVGYVLLSFNIIWSMKVSLRHLVVFFILSGASGLVGLLDLVSLYMVLTIILMLAIGNVFIKYPSFNMRRILGSKHVVIAITVYYMLTSIILLTQFSPIIPELLGLIEVRRVLSIMLVSKISYLLVSLIIVATVFSLYKDILLYDRGLEPRRKLLAELTGLVETITRGRDSYFMFIVEIMLIIASILVYPVTLFLLAQVHLILGGLTYIAGIIITYILWIIMRTLVYKLFSPKPIDVVVAKKTLKYIWTTIAVILLIIIINPSTTSIVLNMAGHNGVGASGAVSLFNRFYNSIINLEFNSIKLLVELLWG